MPRTLRFALVLALGAVLSGASACKRKHVPIEPVAELPYPQCDGGARREIASRRLRATDISLERDVVERFTLVDDGCHFVMTVRQDWRLAGADVEVIYDRELRPLRAWRRMTIPGSPRPDGHADIRRYELRTADLTIKKKTPDGVVAFEKLLPGGRTTPAPGARVAAVIGPGRGLLSMWAKRAKLPVGGKARELVLDFREMVEQLQEVTLTREVDRFESSLGRSVRVYTVYGREAVFTDDDDVVLGDLGGMRPAETVASPEPPPLPTFGPPEPQRTP